MFTFPPQEHKLRINTSPFDPATRKHAGEIVALDREERRLELKRGPSLDEVPLPEALIPGDPYRTDAQEAALSASAARCSPATTATRRSSRCCGASRSTGRCRRTTSTSWRRCCSRSTAATS